MRRVRGNRRLPFFDHSGRLDSDAVVRAIGGGLLIATGADHLDLYLTGYKFIPTIGVAVAPC